MLDEEAIRQLVASWTEATRRGDLDTVLSLMADDVIFTVPGREPFGKSTFAQQFSTGAGGTFEAENKIVELKVLGDWAYLRNHISIRVTPPSGEAMRMEGYTLTILRKENGAWLLKRDANMVTPKS
jgi:uncharacterized protein (TIGR02246 family)